MLMAAMISAAAVSSDIEEIIQIGLSQIPPKSRLSERINQVLKWKKEDISYKNAIDKIHNIYDENSLNHFCHTFPNAMVVCLSLLYGEIDFEKSIGLVIMSAFDTDCNAATTGSILGMMLGARALPGKWISPLNDRMETTIGSMGIIQISKLARRTIML